jgi:hypothetical protein
MATCLTGCGRIGFDVGGGDGANGDGDGSTSTTGTCSQPVAVPVGVLLDNQSIANPIETIDVFGTCRGPAVVYRITVPTATNADLDVLADFDGYLTVALACPPGFGTCQGFGANSPYTNPYTFQAGDTYLVLWKSGGSGTRFSVHVR